MMNEKKVHQPIRDDDLLAYRGRPSFYYPAVRAISDDDDDLSSPFPHRLARGLGTAKFLCGACLALLGGMAVYVQAWSAWMYGGIWSGLFAIFTGLCIVLASRKRDGRLTPRKALLVALLILSILGFFNTGLLATFTAMGLVAEVYMEDVAGALVWKGVENASPFTVQLLLLATATADCLLSLACCVISGRQVCCCGEPTPALVHSNKQERLISWLGSQQQQQHYPYGVGGTMKSHRSETPPPVRLVPSVRKGTKTRPKTPSTLRVFPPPGDISESLTSSTTTTRQSAPLVRSDELGKSSRSHRSRSSHPRHGTGGTGRRMADSSSSSNGGGRCNGSTPERKSSDDDGSDSRPITVCLNDRYLALDRQLSEEFIDRSLHIARSDHSTA